jgi:C-terminal processing protease CtpA/Prc
VADRWNADAFLVPAGHLSEAQRIAGLSLFWSEARYNFAHFDHVPDLDWNQTYLDFLPRVIAAKNLHDYYDVLMRLAPLLHDAHTNIYPPASIQDEFYASPPIDTALIQNRVIVTWVGDPRIVQKGLHVGDEIVSIDGQEVHQYAKEHVEPYASSSTPQDLAVRMYTYQLLGGDHSRPVTLGVKDASGRLHTLQLSREPDQAAKWPAAFEFRMLPGDMAYLKLGEFEDDRGAKLFQQHLREIMRAKGLILDVRDNGGGSTNNGLDVLTWLSSNPIPKPSIRSREYVPTFRAWGGPSETWKNLDDPDNTYSHPRKHHYTGPVAVLIGPRTFSAAEDFVVSFEAIKRGILIGRKTAGSTGQPLVFKLPGGGTARICTLDETFPDGRKFVGIGIPPQIKVEPTVADVRAGRDPAIAASVKVLEAKFAHLKNP